MESLIVTPTDQTFGINFDLQTGEFSIQGRSLPEDINAFFGPVMSWVDDFIEKAPRDINVTFDVDYFHTATMKLLLELFNAFERLAQKGKNVEVLWKFHEDDGDMEDTGLELSEIVSIPFRLESYTDE